MAEKITLKNMLANLPQKTDVDTVVGRDSSGNPVYIKKSDLAQVVAELMPVATAEKNGLMPYSLILRGLNIETIKSRTNPCFKINDTEVWERTIGFICIAINQNPVLAVFNLYHGEPKIPIFLNYLLNPDKSNYIEFFTKDQSVYFRIKAENAIGYYYICCSSGYEYIGNDVIDDSYEKSA